MHLGNLLQFKPEPTAGPMITATQFNEEYEAMLKTAGRPSWSIMSPQNMLPVFISILHEIISSKVVQNHLALPAWVKATE